SVACRSLLPSPPLARPPGPRVCVGLADPLGLAVDPAGERLYVTGLSGGSGAVVRFALARTGRLTPRGDPVPLPGAPDGVALAGRSEEHTADRQSRVRLA